MEQFLLCIAVIVFLTGMIGFCLYEVGKITTELVKYVWQARQL